MNEYDPNYIEVKNFYLIGVKTVVINSRNEVLLLRRSGLSPRPGDIDLPGGAVDAHESPEAAAIRETFEETGIVIDKAKIITSEYTGGHKDSWVMLGFSAHIDEAEVLLSWEHDEYKWVPIHEIQSSGLSDSYRNMIQSASVGML